MDAIEGFSTRPTRAPPKLTGSFLTRTQAARKRSPPPKQYPDQIRRRVSEIQVRIRFRSPAPILPRWRCGGNWFDPNSVAGGLVIEPLPNRRLFRWKSAFIALATRPGTPPGNAVKDFSALRIGIYTIWGNEIARLLHRPSENTSAGKESGVCRRSNGGRVQEAVREKRVSSCKPERTLICCGKRCTGLAVTTTSPNWFWHGKCQLVGHAIGDAGRIVVVVRSQHVDGRVCRREGSGLENVSVLWR